MNKKLLFLIGGIIHLGIVNTNVTMEAFAVGSTLEKTYIKNEPSFPKTNKQKVEKDFYENIPEEKSPTDCIYRRVVDPIDSSVDKLDTPVQINTTAPKNEINTLNETSIDNTKIPNNTKIFEDIVSFEDVATFQDGNIADKSTKTLLVTESISRPSKEISHSETPTDTVKDKKKSVFKKWKNTIKKHLPGSSFIKHQNKTSNKRETNNLVGHSLVGHSIAKSDLGETQREIFTNLQAEYLQHPEKKFLIRKNLSEYLQRLTSLQIDNINFDKLDFLSHAQNLEDLTLNHITDNGDSVFQDLLTRLPNVGIKKLIFTNNNLQHIKEEGFEKIAQLAILDLNNNSLEDLPLRFVCLHNLKDLYLQNNKFAKIPISIFSLQNLEELDFSHNKVKNIESCISEAKNMKFVNLSHNQISYLPEEIMELDNLKKILLDVNSLLNIEILVHKNIDFSCAAQKVVTKVAIDPKTNKRTIELPFCGTDHISNIEIFFKNQVTDWTQKEQLFNRKAESKNISSIIELPEKYKVNKDEYTFINNHKKIMFSGSVSIVSEEITIPKNL